MAVRLANADIKSVSHNSIEQVAYLENVNFDINFDMIEGSSIANPGQNPCVTKQEAMFGVSLFSNSVVACRLSNLDLSAISIGGVNVYAYMTDLNFTGQFTLKDASGVADRWKVHQVVKKHYTADLDLLIPAASNGIKTIADLFVGSLANIEVVLTFTLTVSTGNVVVTIPTKLEKWSHSGSDADLQKVKISVVGSAPGIGSTYPTSPTGTTSILENAFNSPNGPLGVPYPVVLDMGNANGVKYSGSFVYKSFGFGVNNGQLVSAKYEFANAGAITLAVGT